MSALLLFRSGSESALQFIGGARTGAPLLFLVRSAERERAPKSKERLMLCVYILLIEQLLIGEHNCIQQEII